ncbi:MAG TPA: hypothetical protein VJH06_02685 [Candidatus Paceibacterota bacterium]
MEDNKTQNKVIETYAEDMAEVISNDTEGLVKKIIHGAEEREIEKDKLSPQSQKNKIFMYTGITLVLLASFALYFLLAQKKSDIVAVPTQFTPLIFNDQSVYIEIAGLKADDIKQRVLNEINTSEVKAGGVDGVYLTENKSVVGLRKLLSLIKSNFAPPADTALVSDNFLIGGINNKFFLLLKSRSTPDIFEPLRAWEGKMFSDLRGFLGVNITSETNYLFTKDFEDGIVENKNARILYDTNGDIVLSYIFADDDSVIITGSREAVREVVLRLASGKIKK